MAEAQQDDTCECCNIVSSADCPVRGEHIDPRTGQKFKVNWAYKHPQTQEPVFGLCKDCWNCSTVSFPWIKSKADLKHKCNTDPEFKDGRFKDALEKRISMQRAKAKVMVSQGKSLENGVYIRMPRSAAARPAEDVQDEDEMQDVKSKKVTHALQHEDEIYQKVMFMTKPAFELHVGDPKILKPESAHKRLPCGTNTQGYFTRYQKSLVGEKRVYVVKRRFSDAKKLDADIMDEGDA